MMVSRRPNLLFVLADQLRAASTPLGEGACRALMPNLQTLAAGGVTFTNALSTCPLCTPYRAMLLTGRHPQTSGHVVNFVETRHDEISMADAFGRAGYRTGWVGKWHLAAGSFPDLNRAGEDIISEGRSRLGFEYFRAYNFHTDYFNGRIGLDGGRAECWEGYESKGLLKYAFEFLEHGGDRPFCLFVSPHQPHLTHSPPFVPESYYERVPKCLHLPPNVAEKDRARTLEMQRHYLAMIAAVDDMLGELLRKLEQTGHATDTLVVFTSDHGTQGGAHGVDPWCKKLPWEESIRVPLVVRLPGAALPAVSTCKALTAPVDLFPTLAGLCGVAVPSAVEGCDLSAAWRGDAGASGQGAVLTMNFTGHPDLAIPPEDPRYRPHYEPWRGVRTEHHHLIRRLNGGVELYDLAEPLQLHNLAGTTANAATQRELERRLDALLAERGDALLPSAAYANWFDARRRIVRNAFGPLPDPELPPDAAWLAAPLGHERKVPL